MRHLYLILLVFFLAGCADKIPAPSFSKSPQISISDHGLFDRLNLSQNPIDYASDSNSSKQGAFLDPDKVITKLFRVWDDDFKASVSESLWVLDIIKKEGFKENLLPYTSNEKAKFSADLYSASTVNHIAIISRNTDIRAFPTKKPYFYDPEAAGEGYPFDNFQLSRIYTNTPIKIVAVSANGAFYYIASAITDGWVDARDVAILTKDESKFIRSSDMLMSVDDKTSIFDTDGKFIERMQVGSFVYENDGTIYSALEDRLSEVKIEKKAFVKFPLLYSEKTFATLAKSLMDEPYGWGGFLDDRDCSMYLRDLFLPFGQFLARNSRVQATSEKSEYIDLSDMNEAKRNEYIKTHAKPFATLLYLKGHILLYLGVVDGEIVALHDAWGFTYTENKIEHRHVIGKPIITTLHMGEKYKNFVKSKSLSSRLQGIRIFQ